MKKIFTLACMASAAMAMSAQSAFNVGLDYYNVSESEGFELSLLGERMATNGNYVAGMDQNSQVPFVWNTTNGELSLIVVTDKGVEYIWNDDYTEIIDTEEVDMPRTGSFHAVSDNGIAAGGLTNQVNYTTYPCLYNMETGELTQLAVDEGVDWEGNPMALGAEAYGISADGKVVAGFRFLEDGWNVQACLWTEEGKTRTDLPYPAAEELGMGIDYVSARGISADGNVVWGYVQDTNTGAWVACHWTKNAEGAYEGHSWASKYYQTTIVDEETWEPIPVENPNPWHSFEPVAMSDNGEWMTLVLTKEVALGPWDQACNYAARLNLKSGELEVLNMGQDADGNDITGPELFGISNDGTCVGRLSSTFIDWDNEIFEEHIDAVIWPAGDTACLKLKALMEGDAYSDGWGASALSYISGDGKHLMGYASDEMGFQTTFVVATPSLDGIHSVAADFEEGKTFDLSGRRVENAQKGFFIVNGKKVIR